MVAAEGAFPHDGYGGLRNYGAPEPVTSSPYPPPGKHLLRLVITSCFYSFLTARGLADTQIFLQIYTYIIKPKRNII